MLDTDALTPPTSVAFLGPIGTYSHQAACQRFGLSADYQAKRTIADVFQSLSSAVPVGLVPQENSIYGVVNETYDLLRSPLMGVEKFIRGDIVLGIQHALVARKGVKLSDVEHVYSHEQALGQCRGFLKEHLPRASLIRVSSTAGAARALLLPVEGPDPSKSAAICSRVVTNLWEGLEVLIEGIQDEQANFTRFYVLSYGMDVAIPPLSSDTSERRALIRVSCAAESGHQDSDAVPNPASIVCLLDALKLYVARLDRRPSSSKIAFHDVYFVEVSSACCGSHETMMSWSERVLQGVEEVRRFGGEVSLLGLW